MLGTPIHRDAHAHGRALERTVADLFRAYGYTTRTNVLLHGRSGARYEVDVLAERDDGLVTSRVAVECKHREDAADTQVVARLRLMREDLDVSEVLLVAPGGWTPAAERGAGHAGVRLWGARELADRIGRAALDDLRGPAPAAATLLGTPRLVSVAEGTRRVRTHAGGLLGMSRDRLVWEAPAWLPVHEVCAAVTVLHGRLRPRPRALRVHLGYDAVTGALLGRGETPMPAEAVTQDAPALPETVAPRHVADAIARALERRDAAVRAGTRARHVAALEALGIDGDAVDVRVEAVRTLHAPVHCALLRRAGGHERIIVLDAATGHVDEGLSDALTTRAGPVTARLAGV